MALLTIDNDQLYYEVHGEGHPIVLAHGLGGNHASWFKQVAVFAKGYQVITFDHRGFGRSTDHKQLGRGGFVADLLALLDHLAIDKATLVGQSMGGGTAITFACQYPERVNGLAICDSLHGLQENEQVSEIMNLARVNTDNLSQLDRVLGASFKAQQPTEALLYQQLNSFNLTDRSNLVGKYAEQAYAPETLASTGIPIIFVAGQDDILFPIDAIRLVQAQVTGSFIVEFDDCGHSAFFEKPVEFNDTILSFLQMIGLTPKQAIHSNAAGYTNP